jgi:Salmonella virulence plasmid 65kDa B protein
MSLVTVIHFQNRGWALLLLLLIGFATTSQGQTSRSAVSYFNRAYDRYVKGGSGNGPFGLGWKLSLPEITRKTDKGLPKYQDAEESDVFILSGAEDLVPALRTGSLGRSALAAAPGVDQLILDINYISTHILHKEGVSWSR